MKSNVLFQLWPETENCHFGVVSIWLLVKMEEVTFYLSFVNSESSQIYVEDDI